jgi:hypothetical protein
MIRSIKPLRQRMLDDMAAIAAAPLVEFLCPGCGAPCQKFNLHKLERDLAIEHYRFGR